MTHEETYYVDEAQRRIDERSKDKPYTYARDSYWQLYQITKTLLAESIAREAVRVD
jgi:hypothetical protein